MHLLVKRILVDNIYLIVLSLFCKL